ERGSFTGADKRRVGYFEEAAGGTLFLDEITEMGSELQVKLLRVLEDRTLRRVGGSQELKVDVRLVSATNRDPHDAIRHKKLREDLFYRLNVFPLALPPLSDRRDDIPLLSEHFRRMMMNHEGWHYVLPRHMSQRRIRQHQVRALMNGGAKENASLRERPAALEAIRASRSSGAGRTSKKSAGGVRRRRVAISPKIR